MGLALDLVDSAMTLLAPPYVHLATSEMWCWSGGRGILKKKLSMCYSIVYYYNGAQRCKQFLQVGQLCWALILLGSALCLPSASVSSVFVMLYIYLHVYMYFKKFCFHPSPYLLVSWACLYWYWPLTWLTNHCPSVLWHCWLGHLTHKIVSEMTYNVSSGTLNTTLPYHTMTLLVGMSDP